ELTGGADRRCSLQAAPQRARVDRHRVALHGEPLSRGVCLPGTEIRELDGAASAEALRGHSFDVPMPHHDDTRRATYGSHTTVQVTSAPRTGAQARAEPDGRPLRDRPRRAGRPSEPSTPTRSGPTS